MRLDALFGLAFATASPHGLTSPHTTNSQAHSSKGTPSPRLAAQLRRIVGNRFQVLFHSPPGVLFTFPSRYFSTIGHQVVFRLGGWSPRLPIGFHVSDGTLDTDHLLRISLTGLSPSLVGLPIPFGYTLKCLYRSEPRLYYYFRFGLFRFRSPLLSESLLISLPPGT